MSLSIDTKMLEDFTDMIRPWQRLAAGLHATGTPITDIAVHVSKPMESVSAFITSTQGQAIVRGVLMENQARIYDLLEAAGVDSLLTLIRIRDSPMSKPAEKISAAKELLSRTLPNVKARDQKPKEGSGHSDDPQEEIERLQTQIQSI